MLKHLLIATALLFTITAQAAPENEARDMGTIRCMQNIKLNPEADLQSGIGLHSDSVGAGLHSGAAGVIRVLLNQVGKYDYDLTAYRLNSVGTQEVLLQSQVQVFQEDVIIDFTSQKDGVHFGIFADELDQSYLEVAGQRVNLVCWYK